MITERPNAPSLSEALNFACETRSLHVGSGILSNTPNLFRGQFGTQPAIVIADENTFAAAGQAVVDAFNAVGHKCLEPFIFRDSELYAEHRYVVQLETALKSRAAVPIAVGSGTINDITKLVAHRLERQYMSVATAASMDGYTAFGASITFEGSKQTFNCPAPTVVAADIDTLSAAPPEMNAAGYADLLAKITAGADWLVADTLGIEPIDERAWNIVQGGLHKALANPEGVRDGDTDAIEELTEGLMLSGLAMQWSKSSRPASGAEHQFSHLWDMRHHVHNGCAPSHGFKVGIGTLAVTALYEFMLEQPLDQLDVQRCCTAWNDNADWDRRAHEFFKDTKLLQVAFRETRAKACESEILERQLQRLRSGWPRLRESLRKQLLPLAELERRLETVGAPAKPEQIGISRASLKQSYWQSLFIRRRFTVLDLALRTGLLDSGLEHIFGSKGIWPIKEICLKEQ